MRLLLAFAFALPFGLAQGTDRASDVLRVGPGVTAPRLIHKVDPEYSPLARGDRIQGNVLLQLVVNEKGRPTEIKVISPLGYGLDERAVEAVEKWTFIPGMKAGKPVKILASIEVNFRFPQVWFDEKQEQWRTTYNENLQILKRTNVTPEGVARAVGSIRELSDKGYPPAMFLAGAWQANGEHGPQDRTAGRALIAKAAAKNYGPALYEDAIATIEGRDAAANPEKGREEMKRASMLGSTKAQFYLGLLNDSGKTAPRDADKAAYYFRLCGARGDGACQYRLGKILLEKTGSQRESVQGIAWIQLASEHGVPEAAEILKGLPEPSAEQNTQIAHLKTQLVRH